MVCFLALVQVHILHIAFEKLGLSPEMTLLLLFGSLVGSMVNIPLFSLRSRKPIQYIELPLWGRIWQFPLPFREGRTVIAVNLGGCIIPVGLCIYFLAMGLVDPVKLIVALFLITVLCYMIAKPVPGLGIGMPLFLAPLSSVIIALLLGSSSAAHLAYTSGVLGVLLGADMLHLKDIKQLGAPIASIGGAGTFDGIFMTGVVAALLA